MGYDPFFGGFNPVINRARRGRDILTVANISFEESIYGTEKKMALRRPKNCVHCDGSGGEPGSDITMCEYCSGSGQRREVFQNGNATIVNMSTCDWCNGDGNIVTNPCTDCNGEGRSIQTKNIVLEIPNTIRHGSRILLGGEGEDGMYGGPPGDIHVEVRIDEHPQFIRDKKDVRTRDGVNINIFQAVLGDTINVGTLEGVREINIPSGTQNGDEFVIPKLGAFNKRGIRGDHILHVNVEIPTDLTEQEMDKFREIYKERQ